MDAVNISKEEQELYNMIAGDAHPLIKGTVTFCDLWPHDVCLSLEEKGLIRHTVQDGLPDNTKAYQWRKA